MKVIIAGSREINNYPLVEKYCNYYTKNYENIIVVSGTCRGADTLGEQWAKSKGYPVVRFLPNWNLGKKAGPLRNKEMAEFSDALILFWDGKSKGSADMLRQAKEHNLLIREVRI